MSTMAATNGTIPLTAYQKIWLASRFLPVIFFASAFIFALTALPNMLGRPLPPLLPVFLGIVLLVLIYQASKCLRDLLSGMAVIEEDELVRSWHMRKGGNSRRCGQFARLGKMRLAGGVYSQAQAGQTIRVCYSPATHIVWSMEAH